MTRLHCLRFFHRSVAVVRKRLHGAATRSGRRQISIRPREKLALAALIALCALFFLLGYWATDRYTQRHPTYREIGPDL